MEAQNAQNVAKICIDTNRDFYSTFQVTPAPDGKAIAFENALDVFPFPGKKYLKIIILKEKWKQLLSNY